AGGGVLPDRQPASCRLRYLSGPARGAVPRAPGSIPPAPAGAGLAAQRIFHFTFRAIIAGEIVEYRPDQIRHGAHQVFAPRDNISGGTIDLGAAACRIVDFDAQPVTVCHGGHIDPIGPPITETAAPPARPIEAAITAIEIRVVGAPHHYLRLLGAIPERHREARAPAVAGFYQARGPDAGPHHVLVCLVFEIAGLPRGGVDEPVGFSRDAGGPLLERRDPRLHRRRSATAEQRRRQGNRDARPTAQAEPGSGWGHERFSGVAHLEMDI